MNGWASVMLGAWILGGLSEATPLELNQPLEKEIGAGEVHAYQWTMRPGDFVRGVVEQRGRSIDVTGYFPDGSKIRSFAGPAQGIKTFRFVAEQPGPYRLELTASGTEGAGGYRIEIVEISGMADRLRITAEEKYHSPRLGALRRQLEAGDRAAVAGFWREIEDRGTPLAETIEGDDRYLLVTFLWRATFETHNVLVVWPPFSVNHPDDFRMTRLADTDLWYKTLRAPKGARFQYQLSPNDTLSRAQDAQRDATAQFDPLNRRRLPDDPRLTKYETASLAELPGAPPQPWAEPRAETPAGKVEQFQVRSTLLGNERSVSVYTPHGYSSEGPPLPLLLLFDEPQYLTIIAAPITLDNLIAAGRITPLVAVLIGSIDPPTRSRELPCNPAFADFLDQELLPWVRRRYHVTSEPRDVTVGGASYGGLAAAYASLRHPESFGNVLCQSGSFWWAPVSDRGDLSIRYGDREPNWLARQYIDASKHPRRFFIEAGLFENDVWGSGGRILETSRHLRDVLLAKGYEVHYQEFAGGHNLLNWRGSLANGLLALVGATHEDR